MGALKILVIAMLSAQFAFCFIHRRNPKLPPFLFGRPPGGFLHTALYMENRADTTNDTELEKFTIDQLIDHNNPSLGTFKQRVQRNTKYYKDNQVIFLMIGGESEATDIWITANYSYITWAQKFGAMVFQLEHRFFGDSLPFGKNISTAALKYLTMTQGIDDVKTFIDQMNKKYGYDKPKWITFGGSYPGCLNAWFRAKYPDLTVGAVASSAPINLKFDAYEYAMVVEEVLEKTDAKCKQAVADAFTNITKYTLTKEGRDILNNKFNLAPRFNDSVRLLDLQNFIANLYATFQGVVQYTYDGRSNITKNGYDVRTMCQKMLATASNEPIDKVKTVIDWVETYYPSNNGGVFSNSYEEMVQELAKTDYSDADTAAFRGWFWLACKEMGYMQTTDQGRNIFGNMLPLNYFVDMCTDVFGPTVGINEIYSGNAQAKKTFPGPDTYNATNIVLPNGMFDPWSSLGMYNTKAGQHLTTIKMEGAAHCADMYPVWESEPASLAAARKTIHTEIQYFIFGTEESGVSGSAQISLLGLLIGSLLALSWNH